MVNRFRIGMIRTQKVHSCGQAVKRYVRFKYNLSRIQSSSISEGSTRAEGGAHPGWMTACGRGVMRTAPTPSEWECANAADPGGSAALRNLPIHPSFQPWNRTGRSAPWPRWSGRVCAADGLSRAAFGGEDAAVDGIRPGPAWKNPKSGPPHSGPAQPRQHKSHKPTIASGLFNQWA